MKHRALVVSMAIFVAPLTVLAQAAESSSRFVDVDAAILGDGVTRPAQSAPAATLPPGPFSRIAIGGSFSSFGPGLQITTFVTPHLNIRTSGSYFAHTTTLTTNGFSPTAKLNLMSASVSADVYPFHSGFRVSPGVLVYNGNKMTANASLAGGTSVTLNGNTYYSANPNTALGITPLHGSAELGLNTTRPAFMVTAGWGNTIPHDGGHWSVPFEAGVAFTGQPSLNANLAGWACVDQLLTECTDVASSTNPIAIQIQNDLGAQIAKWKSNLSPLGTYPIVSLGVAYSFGPRSAVR